GGGGGGWGVGGGAGGGGAWGAGGRPRLVPGGALPGPEHLGSLPALPPGRARRRLARGRPDRRGGAADEPGWGSDHVGQQDRRRGFRGGGIGFVSTRQDRPAFYAVGRGTG